MSEKEVERRVVFFMEKWCHFCYAYTKWEMIFFRPSHCSRCHRTEGGGVIESS